MNITKREKEILKMSCLPSKEIAERLCLSEKTVKTHRTHLYNKFSLPFANIQSVLIEALKHRVITLEDLVME